jgi:hypothetical protein
MLLEVTLHTVPLLVARRGRGQASWLKDNCAIIINEQYHLSSKTRIKIRDALY